MKKLFAIVLAMAVMLSVLAGCGGNYTAKNKEFFIGATGPLTGDTASYGISVNEGAMLAVKEINAAGGLNGVMFKYEMKDDKSTAADAAIGYDTLFEAGMNVSIGSVTSGSCDSFASKADEDGLFFITPSASAANVIENRPTAFRVCFGDPDQGILAAQEITKEFSNIGCIYDTSDPYSKGIYDAFEAEMKNLGKEFKAQSFNAETKTDFSIQVEALKDCDVIFLPIYYTEAGLIAKAATAKGSTALLFGCDGFDGVADQIDDSVKNEIKYITPFDVNSTNEKTAKFVEAYKAEYDGKVPDQFAADGYDAVMAIYEAMKKADVKDPTISAKDLADLIIPAITAEDFVYVGATGEMKWDASGACTKVPQIIELNK
ncbi:MAG: ABC transporter substrate-binding protein [Clostridia bacterium]|nr:ABC transporter substrate-binding protein [Clostridia bacterium]